MKTHKTFVEGRETVQLTEEKRTRKFLWFFDLEWWEIVSRKHIANDIVIRTVNPIRAVYVNGEEYTTTDKQ